MGKAIAVGVSGGVDSAVCVMMLKNAGYSVTGVMLGMYGGDESSAAGLSAMLGIPVIYRDVKARFDGSVIEPFIDGVMSGATPSPCTVCNPAVKWRELRAAAGEIGASVWATGHYCRITEHGGRRYVTRGVDPVKDQSYYLWRLDDELLSGAVMPLGDSLKSDIKAMAVDNGLAEIASRRESMGVCFFGSEGYASQLRERCRDRAIGEGPVCDASGRTVAMHRGFPYYTVGQRRGLDIPAGMCVTRIDAAANTLYIGRADELYTCRMVLADISVRDVDEFFSSERMTVSVRGIGRNPEGFVSVRQDGDRVVVNMTGRGAWAVCKGQPAVFYIDDRVVGGGIVCDE